MAQPLWKIVWWFLTKLNIFIPNDPTITLLGLCLMELKTYVHAKSCTQTWIAALFITAKIWKQARCPSVNELVKKLWYIQTMGFCSVLKRNELSSNEKTWRNLTFILLSGRSQPEKASY